MSLKRKKETLDEELEELKLTKYGCGLKLTGFTSMLGWAGMIIATVTTIGALTVFAFLIDTARLGIDICRKGGLQESGDFSTSGLYGRFWHSGGLTCGISIGFGLFFFILSPYWFYLSYQLRNKVQEHDLVGITRTLKIICYIQAAFSIILYGPLMVFPILLIIGIARRRTVFVKIFIIFQLVMIILINIAVIVVYILAAVVTGYGFYFLCGVLYSIGYTLLYVYANGHIIALHSIMEHHDNKYKFEVFKNNQTPVENPVGNI